MRASDIHCEHAATVMYVDIWCRKHTAKRVSYYIPYVNHVQRSEEMKAALQGTC